MVQPIVGNDDEEYTTSAFCDGIGGFFAYMTLKRKLSKDGFTEKAEVADLDNINDVLVDLCKLFKPLGPTNFQFRKHNGVLKLLEINPRISSSTSIRAKFGYNESLMSIEYFLEEKKIGNKKREKLTNLLSKWVKGICFLLFNIYLNITFVLIGSLLAPWRSAFFAFKKGTPVISNKIVPIFTGAVQ